MSTQALRQAVAPTRRPDNFPAMLEAYKTQIATALPKHLSADNMARIALTCFRMNPKLSECQPASVFAAVIQASQLGLRPGLLGEAYLIPYKDQCQLQIGYQGLLELARRSGLVESISVQLVYAKDTFKIDLGTQTIVHEPYLDGPPGDVRLGYGMARLKGGGTHIELMRLYEILAIRDRSQNVQNAKRYGKKTPWDTDFDEMARKTVARRLCKWLPKSTELAQAMALSDAADNDAQQISVADAIAGTFVPPPIEGEATEVPKQEAATTPPPADAPAPAQTSQTLPEQSQPAAASPVTPPAQPEPEPEKPAADTDKQPEFSLEQSRALDAELAEREKAQAEQAKQEAARQQPRGRK